MGLDLVELVLQTEEVFAISIPDDEAEQIRTVGDLYRLVLAKLDIPYQPAQIDAASHNPRARAPTTAPEVWASVRGVIVDQLQIDEEDVREDANFSTDLGAD